MNKTSQVFDRDVDEFERSGLDREACETIECSRLANAPASLECQLSNEVRLSGETNFVIFGEVVGVHLRDDCLIDGVFDVTTFRPLTRLGYNAYASIDEVFSLKRPQS